MDKNSQYYTPGGNNRYYNPGGNNAYYYQGGNQQSYQQDPKQNDDDDNGLNFNPLEWLFTFLHSWFIDAQEPALDTNVLFAGHHRHQRERNLRRFGFSSDERFRRGRGIQEREQPNDYARFV